MNLHIITACSRPGWLLPAMNTISMAADRAQMKADWTLIVNPEERRYFPKLWTIPWIHFFVTENCFGNLPGVMKQNDFMANCDIDPETFLWMFSDDNLIPVNVLMHLELLSKNAAIDVFVTSHKRGQRRDVHECHDLIAAPENTRSTCISGEQYFFKRKHWTPWQTQNNCGDGNFIEELYRKIPDKFLFLPNLWTTFDAQKSARWDEAEMRRVVFEKGGVGI